MADYSSLTIAGDWSNQTHEIRMTGGRLTFAEGANIAGATFNVEIAAIDEGIPYGGVIEGVARATAGNRASVNVTVTAGIGEYHAIEQIMNLSAWAYVDVVVQGEIGGPDTTVKNAVKLGPGTYTGWPKRSTKNCTFRSLVTGGNEEKVVFDPYGYSNFVRTGYVSAIDVGARTVTLTGPGWVRLTPSGGNSYSGLHLSINVAATGNEANNGKVAELAGGAGSTFEIAPLDDLGIFAVGDFVTIASCVVDCDLLDSTITSDHGIAANWFVACFRCRILRCVGDVADGFYSDGMGANNLVNQGFGTVGLIFSTDGSSDRSGVTVGNTAYMGASDNEIIACRVNTNKVNPFGFWVVFNTAYNNLTQDYHLDYLPAHMPKMFGWRNRLVDCSAEHKGVDAQIAVFDQREFRYLWNDLPAKRDPIFEVLAGSGLGNTYAADTIKTTAARVGNSITITADADATSTLYGWDADPSIPYTAPIEPPAGAIQFRFRSTLSGFADEPIRTLAIGGMTLRDGTGAAVVMKSAAGDTVTLTRPT
jgi:hypothetical protein